MFESSNIQSSNHGLDKAQDNLGYGKTENIKKDVVKHQTKKTGGEDMINIKDTISKDSKMKYETEYILAVGPSLYEAHLENVNSNLKLFYAFEDYFGKMFLLKGVIQSESLSEISSELIKSIKSIYDNHNEPKSLFTILYIIKSQDVNFDYNLEKELAKQTNKLHKQFNKDSNFNLNCHIKIFIEKEDILNLLGCEYLVRLDRSHKLISKTNQLKNYYSFFKKYEEFALESMKDLVNIENTMIHNLLKHNDVFAYCILNDLHVDFPSKLNRIAGIAKEMALRIK